MSEHSGDYVGDELALFSLANNWKSYWSSKLAPLLGYRVLDVGAGIGSNIELLKRDNIHWTALEPDQAQASEIQSRFGSQSNLQVICGTLASMQPNDLYDSIIYIDVLEHIEQDAAELTSAANHLNAGGRVIVLAPAHQSLFSPFDAAVGHFRRYNKVSLQATCPDSLHVEHLYYLDSVGYAASWFNARLLRSSMPTPGQISLWDKLMVPFSRIFDKLLLHRFGKTIVMVLKKA